MENQRKNALRIVQNFTDEVCTSVARKKLIDKLFNLNFDTSEELTKHVDKKEGRKCRYYNKGYCKNETECNFYHPENVCDKFLSGNECSDRGCTKRHPRSCKFWLKDSRGCFRGDSCKYLHREEEKGKQIKDLENKNKKNKQVPTEVSQSNVVIVEKESEVKEQRRESHEMAKAELNDNVEVINGEKKAIEDELTQVKSENSNLSAQLDKLKRVLSVMDKQLKLQKGNK